MGLQRRTSDGQTAFLAAMRLHPSVTDAARAAGITRTRHYYWLRTMPEYAAAFDVAREAGIQLMLAGIEERCRRCMPRRSMRRRDVNRRFVRALGKALARDRFLGR